MTKPAKSYRKLKQNNIQRTPEFVDIKLIPR